MTELSRLQRDILELEATDWALEGEKLAEFRRRHRGVTATGYEVALGRLLTNPDAYEYDNRRYAPMLARLAERAGQAADRRTALRTERTP